MLRGCASVLPALLGDLPALASSAEVAVSTLLASASRSLATTSSRVTALSTTPTTSTSSSSSSRSSSAHPASTSTSQPGTPYLPWTPSAQLVKRKIYKKRMHYLVQELEKENAAKVQAQKSFPPFKAGDVLELKMIVPEAQRKEYIVRGVCIARYNKAYRTSFKIYNVFPEVGGVVQHFPLYMPDLQEIKVVGKVKSNKHKLYHLLKRETQDLSFQSDIQLVT